MPVRDINLNSILGMDLRDNSVNQQLTKEIINLDKTSDGWKIREPYKVVFTLETALEDDISEWFVVEDCLYIHYIDNSVEQIRKYSLSSDLSTIGSMVDIYTFTFSFKMFKTNFNNIFFLIDVDNKKNYVMEIGDRLTLMINDVGDLDASTEFLLHTINMNTNELEWCSMAKHALYTGESKTWNNSVNKYLLPSFSDGTLRANLHRHFNQYTNKGRNIIFSQQSDILLRTLITNIDDTESEMIENNPYTGDYTLAYNQIKSEGYKFGDVENTNSDWNINNIINGTNIATYDFYIKNVIEYNNIIYVFKDTSIFILENNKMYLVYTFPASNDVIETAIVFNGYIYIHVQTAEIMKLYKYNGITAVLLNSTDINYYYYYGKNIVNNLYIYKEKLILTRRSDANYSLKRDYVFCYYDFDNNIWVHYLRSGNQFRSVASICIYRNELYISGVYSASDDANVVGGLLKYTESTDTISEIEVGLFNTYIDCNDQYIYYYNELSRLMRFYDETGFVKQILYSSFSYVYRYNNYMFIALTNGVLYVSSDNFVTQNIYNPVIDGLNYLRMNTINNIIYLFGYSGNNYIISKLIEKDQTTINSFYPTDANSIVKYIINTIDKTLTKVAPYINISAKQVKTMNIYWDNLGNNYAKYLICIINNYIVVYLVDKSSTLNYESGTIHTGTNSPLLTVQINSVNLITNGFVGMALSKNNYAETTLSTSRGYSLFVIYDNCVRVIDFTLTQGTGSTLAYTVRTAGTQLVDKDGNNYFNRSTTPQHIISITPVITLTSNTNKHYLYIENYNKIWKMPITGNVMTASDVEQIEEIYAVEMTDKCDPAGSILGMVHDNIQGYTLTEINQPKKFPIRPYFFNYNGNITIPYYYSYDANIILYQNSDVIWSLTSIDPRNQILIGARIEAYKKSAPSTIYINKETDKVDVIDYVLRPSYLLSSIAVKQGLFSANFNLTKTACAITADQNTIIVGTNTGLHDGMLVSNANFPVGTIINNISGTTITVSNASTGTYASISITFVLVAEINTFTGSYVIETDLPIDVLASETYVIVSEGLAIGGDVVGCFTEFGVRLSRSYIGTTIVASDLTINFFNRYLEGGIIDDNREYNIVYESLNSKDVGYKNTVSLSSGTGSVMSVRSDDTAPNSTYIFRNWLMALIKTTAYDNRGLGSGGIDYLLLSEKVNGEIYYWEYKDEYGSVPYRFYNNSVNNSIDPQFIIGDKLFFRIGDKDYDQFNAKSASNILGKIKVNVQDMTVTSWGLTIFIDYDNRKLYYSYGKRYQNLYNDVGMKSRPVAVQEMKDGQCIVLCENDIYMVSGTTDQNLIIQHMGSGIGLEYGNYMSLVTDAENAFIYNKNGIYKITSAGIMRIQGMDDYLYKRVSGNMIGIDKNKGEIYVRLDKSKLTRIKTYLQYTAPTGSPPSGELKDYGIIADETVDYSYYIGVYDYINGLWKIYAYAYGTTEQTDEFYDMLDTSMVMRMNDKIIIPTVNFGETGADENPVARLITRRHTFGDTNAIKHINNLFISFLNNDIIGYEYGANYCKIIMDIDDKSSYNTKYGLFKHTRAEYTDLPNATDWVGDIVNSINSTDGIQDMPLPMNIDFRKLRVTIEFARLKDDTHHSRTALRSIQMDVFDKNRNMGGIR